MYLIQLFLQRTYKLVETDDGVLRLIEPTLSPSGESIILDEYDLLSISNYEPIIILDHQLKIKLTSNSGIYKDFP